MYDVDPRQGSLDEVDAGWFGTDEGTLPIGAPFRPGLDPLPPRQHAWAVVKDRWGRPAHGEPRSALRRVTMPVRLPGPDEALGYVLYAGLTYNTIFAARGVPISVFDLHDRDLHVPGSGAVVLVAALGRETARQGRLKVGELRVLYPGASDLLSPRAGADPMHADFRIQGYETPDGSFTQFVRCQAPQLLAHSERLTLPEASSYMLDLETVYKALYDVARVDYDERVFIEGAAGGTGLYAVACSALRGARVTGLVSTEEKGRLVLARGGLAYVNRKDPALAGAFVPVPRERSGRASWLSAGRKLVEVVRDRNGGALIDVVVSSVGRDLFPRMIDLLAPSGRLVFYGATSGYTLTFLGKPGNARAGEMMRRGGLRPHHGVLVYYGGRSAADPVGDDAISTAVHAGARVAVATRTDAEAAAVKAAHRVAGVVSLQTLARDASFRWPDTMPDYDVDPDVFREYQDRTLKPFGQAVGRVLATPDNPRGNPDMIVERAGQDTLGVSTFLARPFTGVVVYLEATSDDRLSFYAPNVWMHQKRVLFPTFAILGSHLSNAQQAEEVVRLLDAGALTTQPPAVEPWDALAEANQAIHENRHAGTITTRVGATAALDEARTARQVYEAWGSRFVDGKAVRVRIDPVRPGAPARVALVTIDVPPANALSAATLDDLERALDVLETEPDLGAAVLTGGGSLFVAGADIRQLRAFTRAQEVEALASRAQNLFCRIARLRAPMIAAVDGYALGGGNELQMACAWRVAAPRAELGQPEINLHVIPGFGGTQMLPRLVARRARAGGGQLFPMLVEGLAVLLDGRRRPAERALALGLIDEIAPADALGHALGVARRVALGTFDGALYSPLTGAATMAFPNIERDSDIRRLLEHHARIPRLGPAQAILDLVRLGFAEGLTAGLAAEAREFGRLVASDDGRAGLDRFLARKSLPLPLRRDDLS
ncbi:MAG TPA: enoyl-CoA hydratase-related protein [Patescibacteria group bacterium]|nr:enoyl-CoA hydratase-related protein [Patescibacteria group bacterium]